MKKYSKPFVSNLRTVNELMVQTQGTGSGPINPDLFCASAFCVPMTGTPSYLDFELKWQDPGFDASDIPGFTVFLRLTRNFGTETDLTIVIRSTTTGCDLGYDEFNQVFILSCNLPLTDGWGCPVQTGQSLTGTVHAIIDPDEKVLIVDTLSCADSF